MEFDILYIATMLIAQAIPYWFINVFVRSLQSVSLIHASTRFHQSCKRRDRFPVHSKVVFASIFQGKPIDVTHVKECNVEEDLVTLKNTYVQGFTKADTKRHTYYRCHISRIRVGAHCGHWSHMSGKNQSRDSGVIRRDRQTDRKHAGGSLRSPPPLQKFQDFFLLLFFRIKKFSRF